MRLLSKSYRVVALDPRSQGDSEKTSEGNYTERRAHDIKDAIDRLRLAPVVVVAWSRAVRETLTMVDQSGTESLLAIVLVDGPLTSELTADRAAIFHDRTRAMLMDRNKYTREQVPSMFRKPHADDLYRKIVEANLKTPTPTAIALQADGVRYDSRPLLKKVDKPVLFVNASTSNDDYQARTIGSELPAAKIEFMKGVGHALFLDDENGFNSILEAFLRTVAGKP